MGVPGVNSVLGMDMGVCVSMCMFGYVPIVEFLHVYDI